MKTKLLFISHDASRSGAPIVFLYLLRWLKTNTDLQFDILLLKDGPLRKEFELIAETHCLQNIYKERSILKRAVRKARNLSKGQTLYESFLNVLVSKNYDLVYGNTILTVPILNELKQKALCKTVCCIHELPFVLNSFYNPDFISESLKNVDRVIAVSEAVAEALVGNYDVDRSKIGLFYEFIDTSITPLKSKEVLINELGLENKFIIGCAGTLEWRKGADLIIPLVRILKEKFSHLDFTLVWLGGDAESLLFKQMVYDIEKCGLKDKICFVTQKQNPLDYINIFDVFVLLSREDPFPLVALEAAFLQKPIIAFKKGGGMPELVSQGAGLLAEYLNLEEIAENIYSIYMNKELKENMGEIGKRLITEVYNSDTTSKKIFQFLNKVRKPN